MMTTYDDITIALHEHYCYMCEGEECCGIADCLLAVKQELDSMDMDMDMD